MAVLRHRGVVDDHGAPGERASWLLQAGFQRLRLDHPPQPTLYANRIGGFQVRCPVQGVSIVPSFGAAMTAWRAGGDAKLHCPACQRWHGFEDLAYRPDAALGPWAVAIEGVDALELRPDAWAEAAEVMGPIRRVLRRS